ncbi:MAG: GAF domain-containing sensor histidine kinase [Candidatus Thermoplasmatota archaeon]|nr:GAF domain-containing sensor histidine kinase [Candidatus Thermoplasmatota archaeon]
MGSAPLRNNFVVIDEIEQTIAESFHKTADSEVLASLGEIGALVVTDRPIKEVVERTLRNIARLFGIAEMLLQVRDETLIPVLWWTTYGIPRERAEMILQNVTADYHPQELIDDTLTEKFRVSANAYYIPAEEWLKILDEDPFADHPAYYSRPEYVRTQRRSPDEWHEADMYKFAIRDSSGGLLASLELDRSVDRKLLSKEAIQTVEMFTQLLGVALEKTRNHLAPERPTSRFIQRSDMLEDVLKIASSIVSEHDLKKLSHSILSSVSSLFGFGKVSLVVFDDAEMVFKWMALFGYPESAEKSTRNRTIPTDVIMEDLSMSKSIGKSGHFTMREEVSSRSASYFVEDLGPVPPEGLPPRKKGEFRRGDFLAFPLRDSNGRVVGVIYPTEPKDGRIPDQETIETMEIFTSLAEVALENARLTHERENALRVSSQRTEQLSRILDLVTSMMYVRDLDQMLDSILKTLARLLGIKRMVLGVKHQAEGVYKMHAVYGYSARAAEAIKKFPYTINQVDAILESVGPRPSVAQARWWKKVGRLTYYMPVESQETILPEELPYYPDPDLLRRPRMGKGYWHELDYMDTLVVDKNGVPIAYLELLKPRDDRIPDAETIEIIEIFASMAGIAIENAMLFQEHVDSRRDSQLYTDVLSHDIKNFNQAILGYLDLLRMKTKSPETSGLIDKIAEQVMNTSWLASNVRTMSRVTFGDVEFAETDIGAVLLECERSVTQYYPGRKIVLKHDIQPGVYFTLADELIREMFVNILTNAVKYDSHEPLEIDVSVETKLKGNRKYWLVSLADRGRGIPDDLKGVIFDRFSKAAKKRGSGLGLHIVMTLAKRYGGSAWVEDRVPGDFSQGAVFKVELPAV